MGRFDGEVVLVTGGSGGIGREVCRRFAAEGARVFVHYGGNRKAAEETLTLCRAAEGGAEDPPSRNEAPGSEIPRSAGGHEIVGADLLDAGAVASLVDRVVERAGRLDVLVNNAGIFERHTPDQVDYEAWQAAWQRTLGINLVGPANACHRAAHHMIRLGTGGRIVNISSRGAFRGEPDCPAYGASKAGINALSQSLAVALAAHGIHVYAVAPGFVETAMARPYLTTELAESIRRQSPLGRVARVGDVAYWVLAMADPEAAFATGAIIDVNGGSYLRT